MSNNENNQLEQLEKEAQDSIRRSVVYDRLFFSYQSEYNSRLKCLKMKDKLIKLDKDVARSALDSVPGSEQQDEKEDDPVATLIKRKAIEYRESYYSLQANDKGFVSLGLNSILDISFDYPDCQSKFFTNKEWAGLRRKYKSVGYDTTEYDRIRSILAPVFQAYRTNKTFDTNWLKMYKLVKKLESRHDPVLDQKHTDIGFCIFFVLHALTIIKYSPALFDANIDSSEWDFVVKFWGPVTERLFRHTELQLKWDDTHLTLNDALLNAVFKVDLRVLNDKMKQGGNFEHGIATLEAAKEDAGNAKFIHDRFKVSIENKVIIDNFLADGALMNSVNALQVSGLGMYILNTTLEEPGLYVTKELHHHVISSSLANLESYLDLALNLLCFRDDYVMKTNTYSDHLIDQKNQKNLKKRNVNSVQPSGLTEKQESIRGTWNPPRSKESGIPPLPKKLWKQR